MNGVLEEPMLCTKIESLREASALVAKMKCDCQHGFASLVKKEMKISCSQMEESALLNTHITSHKNLQ